jgi:hypothetical protein
VQAAWDGNVALIERAAAAHPNIGLEELVDGRGRTLLHVALERNDAALTSALLGARSGRALLVLRDGQGLSPLDVLFDAFDEAQRQGYGEAEDTQRALSRCMEAMFNAPSCADVLEELREPLGAAPFVKFDHFFVHAALHGSVRVLRSLRRRRCAVRLGRPPARERASVCACDVRVPAADGSAEEEGAEEEGGIFDGAETLDGAPLDKAAGGGPDQRKDCGARCGERARAAARELDLCRRAVRAAEAASRRAETVAWLRRTRRFPPLHLACEARLGRAAVVALLRRGADPWRRSRGPPDDGGGILPIEACRLDDPALGCLPRCADTERVVEEAMRPWCPERHGLFSASHHRLAVTVLMVLGRKRATRTWPDEQIWLRSILGFCRRRGGTPPPEVGPAPEIGARAAAARRGE